MAPVKVTFPVEVKPVKPLNTPAVETSQLVVFMVRVLEPPPIVVAPVDVPVLIFVAKLELLLMLVVAPEIVAPSWPVMSPATVSAPLMVVSPVPVVKVEAPL